MELWVGAVSLGLLYALVSIGVFITFRIHDFPDVTPDGSVTLGAAVGAVLMVSGASPVLAVAAGFAAGAVAGVATALIHTKLNVNGLLAGILVMTALYSINLRVMERSNIPLLNTTTCFTYLQAANPGVHPEVWTAGSLLIAGALLWLFMTLFLKTDLGMTMRAVGNNPDMAAANGVNVHAVKTFGIGLANGFAGACGCLVAQYQGFADIGMGLGSILMGLAAVIIGESVITSSSVPARVFSVLLGSVLFRLMIACALAAGMNPIDLKLLTAFFVLLTLVLSLGVSRKQGERGGFLRPLAGLVRGTRARLAAAVVVLAVLGVAGYRHFGHTPAPQKRLAVLVFNDSQSLVETVEGMRREFEENGVLRKHGITMDVKSAQNEFTMVQSLAQDIVRQRYDYVITLTTPALQAMAKANKTIPHIFGAVTDPYRTGAARTPDDHQPNVTGMGSFEPVEETIAAMRKILPKAKRIGLVWNPAEGCSEACTYKAREVVGRYGFELVEATVSNSGEIPEALRSTVSRGIDVFLTSGDNTVAVAVGSIAQYLKEKRIPYFTNDPSDIARGAFVCIGVDYVEVGRETARIATRVLNGEDPKNMPIVNLAPDRVVVNLPLARDYGITIPDEILKKAAQSGKKP
ncbi:MAG: hypothetical protein NTW87_05930 [Planctomycetota bacterium]|nr:hypothetical protein [Planctomycetota bacterium]